MALYGLMEPLLEPLEPLYMALYGLMEPYMAFLEGLSLNRSALKEGSAALAAGP